MRPGYWARVKRWRKRRHAMVNGLNEREMLSLTL